MISSKARRPRGRYPSPQSRPPACIAFTTSNAIGRLVIVAVRCDMGGAPLCAWQPQLEYPLPRPTQNLLRHPSLANARLSRMLLVSFISLRQSATRLGAQRAVITRPVMEACRGDDHLSMEQFGFRLLYERYRHR